MKALVSPNEPRETGYRIAQISESTFDVASPLFWVNCDDYTIADRYWYDPADQTIKEIPIMVKTDQPMVAGAQSL